MLDQHREIRDAVSARDPARARQAVETHLDFVGEALREADRARSREQIAELRRDNEERRATRSTGRRSTG